MLDRSAALYQRMTEREYNVRKNALDYLDDIVVGARSVDLSDESRANIAIFLVENLIPIAEEEDALALTALLPEETP